MWFQTTDFTDGGIEANSTGQLQIEAKSSDPLQRKQIQLNNCDKKQNLSKKYKKRQIQLTNCNKKQILSTKYEKRPSQLTNCEKRQI